MGVTNNETVFVLTTAADELAGPIRVSSIRWVGGASSVAGNALILTESAARGDTAAVLWESVAAGANYVEADSNGSKGFDFRNGVRIGTIDVGTLYLYI